MYLIENYIARVEQDLNYVDWVPYAASMSGMVRILSGMSEICAAAAFTAIKITEFFLTNQERLFNVVSQGFIYALHGLGNMVRGSIAMIPGLNLALIWHDYKLGRMNYPQEELRKGVYPIMTAYKLVQNY